MLHSRCFHILATPDVVIAQCKELLDLREMAQIEEKPIIIWEPLPSSCRPSNLDIFHKAAHVVDVFSPNHMELAAIFRDESINSSTERPQRTVTKAESEEYASKFLQSGIGESGQGSIVIRAGEEGCLILSPTQEAMWLPPFYDKRPVVSGGEPSSFEEVVDPTGAGNAFLGALAVGLHTTNGNLRDAAYYGAVGASYALEQVGLPEVRHSGDGTELWNGSNPFERLEQYKLRCGVNASRSSI